MSRSHKIGAIAERLGTTVRTLRFYEEQGLVRPGRTPGGTRVYSADDEARFAALLALTKLGFPLKSLVELAGMRPSSTTGDEAGRKVAERLRAMRAELEQRARAIEAQRSDIDRALALVEQCRGCQRAPVRSECDRCEIASDQDDIAVLQVVWDERPHG